MSEQTQISVSILFTRVLFCFPEHTLWGKDAMSDGRERGQLTQQKTRQHTPSEGIEVRRTRCAGHRSSLRHAGRGEGHWATTPPFPGAGSGTTEALRGHTSLKFHSVESYFPPT